MCTCFRKNSKVKHTHPYPTGTGKFSGDRIWYRQVVESSGGKEVGTTGDGPGSLRVPLGLSKRPKEPGLLWVLCRPPLLLREWAALFKFHRKLIIGDGRVDWGDGTETKKKTYPFSFSLKHQLWLSMLSILTEWRQCGEDERELA